YGSDAFRESIALLLGESWGINNLDKDDVFTVSGVSAALECLAFALFRKGDGAILPAPLWYGFPWSLVDRPGMNFYPFSIEKQGAETAFELTLEDIRRAYNDTTPSPRVLILTNPGNPLGTNYPEKLLDEIFHWVLNCTDMHIISDEIYGFSQVDTGKEKVPFKSAFSLDAYTKATPDQQERVHLVWGLAKDFGLSGFKTGFVISKSSRVKQAMRGTNTRRTMSWFSPFNSLNQYMLSPLFLDKEGKANPTLAIKAMDEYRGDRPGGSLLANQYGKAREHLKKGGIKYTPRPDAAIFFWLDLREYLERVPETKDDGKASHPNIAPVERRLSTAIRENAKLYLIPGMECYNTTPGFFRLCYTAAAPEQVTRGIDNLAEYLKTLK
ncbi:MAG: aminotransferase class I/II-fold pyridoxal phosphate-dependent enzyme, partial [Desulfobacterales bacterium]|nr:aminotransferase class I/II-fold pyridoxal phosphate-dependent enzyme [Desulfobacterales bacterium]